MERNYILFDTPARALLYPFTHTRPVAACRVGILTIQEKWERWLNTSASFLTVPYLQEKYPLEANDECVLINGQLLPDAALVAVIQALQPGQVLYKDTLLLAACKSPGVEAEEQLSFEGEVLAVQHPWDFFLLNDKAIRADFALITAGRTSAPIPAGNQVTAPENVFIEPGANVSFSIINAAMGPVYIGRNAEVMEGCLIRGPFALCKGAALKMGTKVYGATTLGPGSVGGGEMKNVMMFGYSNKGHDGYLGDAVLGEWCNLGGNTTNSNLKNNASTVKVWMEAEQGWMPAGMKCGLIMGDFSRSGIGTMFNTGSVVGVSCNIFGGDLPPKFTPSFSWGPQRYRLEEVLRDAASWMKFKGQELTEADARILTEVYGLTAHHFISE
jgi:UDP-N-acetylglucosamine diphosphorylase/glucosamine-1-phosphate N-acetyltransferase